LENLLTQPTYFLHATLAHIVLCIKLAFRTYIQQTWQNFKIKRWIIVKSRMLKRVYSEYALKANAVF